MRYILCGLALILVSGCSSFDPISLKNANRMKVLYMEDADPALDPDLKKAALEEIDSWAEYEESKK